MEHQKLTFPSNNKNWDEKDNFAEFSGEDAKEMGGELLDKAEDVAVEVVDTLEDTFELVKDETKALVPSVEDTIKRSSKRLQAKERVISFIPNDFLYFGIVGLGTYLIIKKLL
jgi:hypothetical protein